MVGCNECRSCDKQCGECPQNCNPAGFRWAVQGCEIRAKLNGAYVDPLPLCDVVKATFPRVQFTLNPNEGDGFIRQHFQFPCDCKEEIKEDIFICDVLNLSKLSCLGDVCNCPPKNCDLLVYNPCAGDPSCEACSDCENKWTAYSIPTKNVRPRTNSQGEYLILARNEKGCIEERPITPPDDEVTQYLLRDGFPDDPDYPFHIGSYAESIDLQLSKSPAFGKKDLKVTVEYTINASCNNHFNIRHVGFPFWAGENPGGATVATANQEMLHQRCWHYDASNSGVWMTASQSISRTFIVPKGKNAFLRNITVMRNAQSNIVPDGGQAAPSHTSYNSRLHGLIVTVEGVKRVSK